MEGLPPPPALAVDYSVAPAHIPGAACGPQRWLPEAAVQNLRGIIPLCAIKLLQNLKFRPVQFFRVLLKALQDALEVVAHQMLVEKCG